MRIIATNPIGYIVEKHDDFNYYKSVKEMLFELTINTDKFQRDNLFKGVLQMNKLGHNVGEFGMFEYSLIWSKKE